MNAGQVDGVTRRLDIGSNASGGFVVVWEKGDGSLQYPIFAKVFDANGLPMSGNVVANLNDSGDASQYPAVSSAANGDFVVVWSHYDDDALGEGYGVQGRAFDATATPKGGPFDTAAITGVLAHDVASAPGGEFVVVWTDNNDDTGYYYATFGRRYDAAGAPLAGAFTIRQAIGTSYTQPMAARDASGGFTVVWAEQPQSSSALHALHGQRFDADEAPVGAEFTVTTDAREYTFGETALHAVSSNASGEMVVAWETYAAPGISVQRYDASGAPVGGPLAVTADFASHADVAVEADGDFAVVWENATGVHGRHFSTADGMGPTFLMNTETGDQSRPAVTATPDGFVASWYDGNPGTPRIVARRYLAPSEGGNVGVTGAKLIVVDKLAAAGKAKLVYLSKLDAGIAKGADGDPAALSGAFEVFYTDVPSIAGRFEMPGPWRTNQGGVAKYVNTLAPGGTGHVKVALVKDGAKAKVSAKGLGDGPALDLFAGPPSASGGVTTALTIINPNDGSARRLCTRFAIDAGSEVVHSEIAQGNGRKLVARDGVPTTCL